jgi:hypothetical protein
LLDALLGHKAKERRLFKLYGKALAQRAIKHRIAGRIREVREDNRVLVCQLRCAVKIEVTTD